MSDPATSAAAPGSAQEARTRPVTNHTAPVDAGSCAAVETAGEAHITTTNITGGPVSGAGVAGMAGSAGAGRPGGVSIASSTPTLQHSPPKEMSCDRP